MNAVFQGQSLSSVRINGAIGFRVVVARYQRTMWAVLYILRPNQRSIRSSFTAVRSSQRSSLDAVKLYLGHEALEE